MEIDKQVNGQTKQLTNSPTFRYKDSYIACKAVTQLTPDTGTSSTRVGDVLATLCDNLTRLPKVKQFRKQFSEMHRRMRQIPKEIGSFILHSGRIHILHSCCDIN